MKLLKSMAMLLAAVTIIFSVASCKDDDDNKPVEPAAQLASGSFVGDLAITVMGQSSPSKDLVYEIKSIDGNTISLTTPAVGEGMMALPSITIENLSVEKVMQDGLEAIVATKDEISGTVGEKSYTITDLTIAVVPSLKTAGVAYSLKYGNMPMAMVFSFKGTQK